MGSLPHPSAESHIGWPTSRGISSGYRRGQPCALVDRALTIRTAMPKERRETVVPGNSDWAAINNLAPRRGKSLQLRDCNRGRPAHSRRRAMQRTAVRQMCSSNFGQSVCELLVPRGQESSLYLKPAPTSCSGRPCCQYFSRSCQRLAVTGSNNRTA